jgi:signal transduction histidine kinase/DNA-binding response OmpR family regulator/ligand-binding sensor domain-containing protein
MTAKPIIKVLFFLLLSGPLTGQEEMLFESLPDKSEIAQSSVNAMLQDRQGYLWFGTWSGLWRYYAYDFRQFGHDSGLNSSKITCLFEEPGGTLWVGTRNTGLYAFDSGKEVFIPANQALGCTNPVMAQNITSVFRDREGRLWIGSEEGLFMFQPGHSNILEIPLKGITPPPSENKYLYSICQTSDGCIWVAGSHGLYRAQPFGNEVPPDFVQIMLHPEGSSPQLVEYHNFVYKVQPVRNQDQFLWAGTKQGLKMLDIGPGFMTGQRPMPGKISYFQHRDSDPAGLSHNFVTDICEGDYPGKNAVWVATMNGLDLFEPGTGHFRQFYARDSEEGSLRSSNIRSLLFDKSGLLWVGTNRGANKLNPHFADFSLHALRRSARSADESVSFLSKTSSNLWASAFGGGLFSIPLENGSPQWAQARHYTLVSGYNSPVNDFISAVIPDGQGYIWCITQGAGVFRFREKDAPTGGGPIRKTEQFTKGNGPRNTGDDYLMSATVTQDGNIWMGCWDAGINIFLPSKNKIVRFSATSDGKADFHMYPVVALSETVENAVTYMYAGTRGGGLFQLRFDEQSETLVLVRRICRDGAADDHIPGDFITSLLPDKQQLWVTTESGLFCKPADGMRFRKVALKNFPQASHYEAIIPAGNSQYWVSTQKGIGCFYLENGKERDAVFYESRNGLRERNFNSGAVLRLSDGQLIFGGSSGLTTFFPLQVKPDPYEPAAVLTGFRLFNRTVLPGITTPEGFQLEKNLSSLDQLVLTHRDNVISIEFSALHFSCPEQNYFAWKLDGFDPDWNYGDASQRLAHYTNLPAGNYTFLVKAANSDGVWNQEPARLGIRVLPPWWRSGWAMFFYTAAFIGLLYLVGKIGRLRANYENRIQLERIEKQKLEEVNQMKLIFFTNISHELKTPLTLIISPLEEIISRRSAGSSSLHNTLSLMHRNAVKLLHMINQLLDIRKAEAGLMKLETEEGNIVQFAGEICLSFRELARQRNCQFELNPEKPVIMVRYDPDQLEKVCYNLLSNAFKFTQPGGIISVTIGEDKEQNRCFIRVKDNGKGIPADKIPYIFERFFRAEETDHTGDEGGTGIGLSLVKMLVEQHHGQIDVESSPGEGSVFTVWLPLNPDNRAAESPRARAEVLQSYLPTGNPVDHGPAGGINSEAKEQSVILLVEDNPDIRQYLCDSFSADYQIVEAGNGQEGLDKTLEYMPDLIICDISMPGMDGLELTKRLKSGVETSHIPIILLTARTSLIFKIDGLELGADDYITKPFNLKLLQLRVKNLIESRRQLREKFARNMTSLEPESSVSAFTEIDQEFLESVDRIIDQYLADPGFSVDDLAASLLMNRKQLYRKIKALTNQTPNDYIRSIRLQRAARLLKTRQFTIAEVTYRVGFQDLKYFRERFRDFYGVNPSEIV